MGIWNHWHAVLKSSALKKKPVAVTVAGKEIVVFRTASGQLGALADACPHRRLKLSVGDVIGEKLQCKYHRWAFNPRGDGESPGSPKLTAWNLAYEIREAHGLIFVAARDSKAPLPELS